MKPLYRFSLIALCASLLFSSTAGAIDEQFYSGNDILYYNPDSACAPTEPTIGTGSVGSFSNPVYKGSAPDPSIITGDNGMHYVYATGGVLLESKDMSNWKKIDNNWKLKGAPNEAGGAKRAPDVAKVKDKYILTYTIPTGTTEIPGGGNPQIAYAIGDSAGGSFTYKGKLAVSYSYSIDSQIFVDDDGTPWLFWGGGEIYAAKLRFTGSELKIDGTQKKLLTKGGVGSDVTIEGAYVIKRDGWYYLTYSQGRYDVKSGTPAYRVLVARSKTVNGDYTPNNSMRPILEGKAPIIYPGHHSITTDTTGTDWIVYHGYFNGERNTRSLNIDKITYDSEGWPVVNGGNGPSSAPQTGSGGVAGTPSPSADNPVDAASACCIINESSDGATLNPDAGGSNAEKLFVFLVSKGLTAVQAAGIVGNVMQESGGGTFNIDPNALNPSSGAFGIAQWYAGRKTALTNYANSQNKPVNDLGMQMDFFWKELNEGYKSSVLEPIQASNDLKTVTRIFLEKFEVPCLPGSSECDAEMVTRMPFSTKALNSFSDIPPASLGTGSCTPEDGGSSGDVNAEGMAFPLGLAKDKVDYLPCDKATCHHDGTPASDMFAPVGTPVYAIEDGSIYSLKNFYDGISGCYSIQLKAKSGWVYWYGHIQSPAVSANESNIKAGQKLAVVGASKCAKNTAPHLHIDRGAPKGRTGGEDCCRDPDFVNVLDKIFEGMGLI
jgi:arabinan endo-1,5-alpha-L-arabinosidase